MRALAKSNARDWSLGTQGITNAAYCGFFVLIALPSLWQGGRGSRKTGQLLDW